jgi:hypothetical protein
MVRLTHCSPGRMGRTHRNVALGRGDRKRIEQQMKGWDKIIVDRKQDLAEWVEVLKTVHKRKIQILAFANNFYCRVWTRYNRTV